MISTISRDPRLWAISQQFTSAARCDDDQLHRGARGADEELARRTLVEAIEVDFGQDDAWRRLPLEPIDRFQQDIPVTLLGTAK